MIEVRVVLPDDVDPEDREFIRRVVETTSRAVVPEAEADVLAPLGAGVAPSDSRPQEEKGEAEDDGEREVYPCQFCGEEFPSKQSRGGHMGHCPKRPDRPSQDGGQEHVCPDCGETFETAAAPGGHKGGHTRAKRREESEEQENEGGGATPNERRFGKFVREEREKASGD